MNSPPSPPAEGPQEIARFDRVSKSFGGRVALRDVTFAARRGRVTALLGPNGAGKSTAFALLLGHLRPASGRVTIRGIAVGRDRRRALRRVGAVPEEASFHAYLSGWENLDLLASYTADPEVLAEEMREAVRLVGLEERIHDRVGTYSFGMRKRLALAQALVPSPELLVLDEPADGLDPAAIDRIHELLHRLAHERGVAVLVASHLLAEVGPICDQVVVLRAGRLVHDAPFPSGAGGSGLREVYREALSGAPDGGLP